jgi:hypothetical protein
MFLKKRLSSGHLTLFSSAIFYIGGLVVFGNAADARLLFYATTLLTMFTFITASELMKRHQ